MGEWSKTEMKHLLIILSFLLLSSPVIGDNHKGETLYRWETSSGKVWKGFGDKDTHRVYKGEWKNGKPNGLGVMTYPDGHKYVGEWKNGKYNGQGTFSWSNGNKYVGEFKDGKQNGRGTFTSHDGIKYEGEFKDGERNGQGTYTFPSGGKYVGEWKDGRGRKYIGEFKDGKEWNGTGYKNGEIVVRFVNGKQQ